MSKVVPITDKYQNSHLVIIASKTVGHIFYYNYLREFLFFALGKIV